MSLKEDIKQAIAANALPADIPVMLVVYEWTKGGQYGQQPKAQAYRLKDDTNVVAFWPENILRGKGEAVAKHVGMTTNNRDTSKVKWYWTTNGCGFDKVHDILQRLHVALGRDGQESTYTVIDSGYGPSTVTIGVRGY